MCIFQTHKKVFIVSILSILFMFTSVQASAAQTGFGIDIAADHAGLDEYEQDVPTLVGNIIGTALSLIGVAFFALMIYGGLRWMFSMGSDDAAKKSLNIIFSAIVGMIIVLAAYAITNFLFQVASVSKNGELGSPAEPVVPTPEGELPPQEDPVGEGVPATPTTYYCPNGGATACVESDSASVAGGIPCYVTKLACEAKLSDLM